MFLPNVRRRATIAGVATALSLGGLAAAAPASASAATGPAANPKISLHAQGCAGDVCIYLSTPSSNGYVFIQAWAYDASFDGHFEITGPGGRVNYSPNAIWPAGEVAYQDNGIRAIVGQYCAIAWAYVGGTWHNIGRACESIG
jgi:hypothetical protein